uniref:G_PROTEIN_RECEP_F1_2 domain-containing protein n=2 Tax=Ascaris TaxID=6251 RepID=A0A0M3HYY3_ASCLU
MRAAKLRFKRERDRRTVQRASSGDSMCTERQLLNAKKVSRSVALTHSCSATRGVIPSPRINGQKTKSTESSQDTTSEEDRTAVACNGHCTVETHIDSAISTNISHCNAKVRQSSVMLARLILPKKRRSKEGSEMKRERKAWRTLAIITGTFVACWTPFFLISLYRPICQCRIPVLLESITNWLGYLNSAINPVIYTVFSLDFRRAFHRILKRLCFVQSRR